MDESSLLRCLQQQQQAARADLPVPLALRLQRLQQLHDLLQQWEARLCAAVDADFGGRSHLATRLSEIVLLHSALRYARRHLRGWMRPRPVATGWPLWPARAWIEPRPLGVVGIMGTWNYPLLLILGPLIEALAAGNRALLKPSERAPRVAEVLQQAVAAHFPAGEVQVITGGVEVAQAFSRLPFDHLLFTGSTAVGRQIALAAASQLTPLTLELGGKSPALVDPSVDIDDCARRLVWAKLLNAGQTCVAPDYVLVPRALRPALVEALQRAMQQQYPTFASNADYTSLIDDRHVERMHALLQDARRQGAVVLSLEQESAPPSRRFPPVLLWQVEARMAIMQEEIFGPLLPLVDYDTPEQALHYLQSQERPLALYWFGRDLRAARRVQQLTLAGGVVLNDCMLHLSQHALPFGGVGASGYGFYHGRHGFERFSHMQSVLRQSRWARPHWLYTPWTARSEWLVRLLRRWA